MSDVTHLGKVRLCKQDSLVFVTAKELVRIFLCIGTRGVKWLQCFPSTAYHFLPCSGVAWGWQTSFCVEAESRLIIYPLFSGNRRQDMLAVFFVFSAWLQWSKSLKRIPVSVTSVLGHSKCACHYCTDRPKPWKF